MPRYKLGDALKKTLAKVEKLSGAEREEAAQNLKTLVGQAKAYEALLGDPAALSASRQKTYQSDQAGYDALSAELGNVAAKLKSAAASNDAARVASLRAEEAEVRTRLKMSAQKLAVSREVARDAGRRSAVEEAKVSEIRKLLSETIALAQPHC